MKNLILVFNEWGTWSECSATCGGGSRTRTRSCTHACDNVEPEDIIQTEDCGMDECPQGIQFFENLEIKII